MRDNVEFERALKELAPILEEIREFERKYGDLLQDYRGVKVNGIMSDLDRNTAAIEILSRYSNL